MKEKGDKAHVAVTGEAAVAASNTDSLQKYEQAQHVMAKELAMVKGNWGALNQMWQPLPAPALAAWTSRRRRRF